MKKIIVQILLFYVAIGTAQDRIKAEQIVAEGIVFHDNRDYTNALLKYDEALKVDKDNLLALTEKGMTLFYSGEFEKVVEVSKITLEKHSKDKKPNLQNVYVNYANALDKLGKSKEALQIYDKGLKEFPEYYQLDFNKGITLINNPKTLEEGLTSFQNALKKNPNHASSHNALGRLMLQQNKRIPAILALCRFLSIEPESKRGRENLAFLKSVIRKNVEVTGENEINITVDSNQLSDGKGRVKENDFSTSDLILSMDTALDHDDSNKNKSEVENFARKLETLIETFKESKKHKGFYWDYYVPYFIEMSNKKYIETFANIVYGSSDKNATAYLNDHKKDVEDFNDWSKNFQWIK